MPSESPIITNLFHNPNLSIADLHLHGKYAISCSRTTTPASIVEMSARKGINLIGTGDILYPPWEKEWRDFLSKPSKSIGVVPTTEISVHFPFGGAKKAFHFILVFSNFEVVDKVRERLLKYGRINDFARPDLYIEPARLEEEIFSSDSESIIIPAHIFTPYFSILGRRGVEKFEDLRISKSPCETGISADPAMCATLKTLEGVSIVSFSDAHSPETIGREATIIENGIPLKKSLMSPLMTIECCPEFGKYHVTGHKPCGVGLREDEDFEICPKCGKKMTLGVAQRIGRLEKSANPKTQPFKKIIPLNDLLAFSLGLSSPTAKSKKLAEKAIESIGSELYILLEAGEGELEKILPEKTTEMILKVRSGNIRIR
ncbi:MAG: hypothetical protein KBC24_05230, partial [Caldisericia bacterium]|nr:hypothetical protein [Caldisericia bacterium]